MVDYWKSQPKKFCEFCKVWIADNKPSIEFHEKGKKHKEFVQAKISEVKKKSAKKREIQEKLDSDLAAIEAAALKAYQKDIAESKPVEYGPEPNPSQTNDSSVEEPNLPVDTGATVSIEDSWAAYKSPEGYTYYYNSISGESTWEPPASFQQNTEENTTTETRDDSQVDKPSETFNKTSESSSQQSSNETRNSPFGAWTTVAVYERKPEINIAEQDDDEKKRAAEEEKLRLRFKEKQTPKINFAKTDLSNETVSFKKRKIDQEKKKRNMRQRTDES